MSDADVDYSDVVNAANDGWVHHNGLTFTTVRPDRVVASMDVKPEHLQAYGLVHGGIYCAMVETVASVGAAVNVIPLGRTTVGLDNHTSFLKAVRHGRLTAEGKPVTRGQRTHVWDVVITDSDGRTAASGRVRLLVLEAGAAVAGKVVEVPVPTTGGNPRT